ncbi:MAG: NAD(P)H-dependent glycerol-3-phosphate dehydrogenase [Chloroflexota bacterium]
MPSKGKITTLGAGGWGTALADMLARSGFDVTLWSFEAETADEINSQHTNGVYLPGIALSERVCATTDPRLALESDIIVNTIPTQFIRSVIVNSRFDFTGRHVVNGSKGIEVNSHKRISEIFAEAGGVSPENFATLTGPSHAEEVARKMPTTVVVASANIDLACEVRETFSCESFRVYSSSDVVGCEIGGALKNVIAIAAGVIDGLGMGDNTKAALITRGLAEMTRLGAALGASPMTFSGLSGLGDLYVTCSSKHSRNRRVGELIGKGKTLPEILSETKMVAEGVPTTKSAVELAKSLDAELPIAEAMGNILFEDRKPLDAIRDLMTRSGKDELW